MKEEIRNCLLSMAPHESNLLVALHKLDYAIGDDIDVYIRRANTEAHALFELSKRIINISDHLLMVTIQK